jgi:hypothetical protein
MALDAAEVGQLNCDKFKFAIELNKKPESIAFLELFSIEISVVKKSIANILIICNRF